MHKNTFVKLRWIRFKCYGLENLKDFQFDFFLISFGFSSCIDEYVAIFSLLVLSFCSFFYYVFFHISFFFVHVRVYFGKSIRCDTKMVIRTNNIFSLCASQNHILFSLLFVYILYIINIFGIILKQTIFDRALYEHMETRSAYPFNHTHE